MAGRRRAVVVGIDNYEPKNKIPPLKGAVNDATEVFESLTKFGKFEVDEENHFLLEEKATSEKIRRAIYELLWKSGEPCEAVLFYFSGHGVQDGHGEGYIAPYDLNPHEPLVRGIRIPELKQVLLGAQGKDNALMILDCCHSGIAAEEGKDVAHVKGPLYVTLENKDEEAQVQGRGRFIIASSGSDENSREIFAAHRIRRENQEEHHHGLFTFHLLEGMNGEAADENNHVNLGRLYEHISGKMQEHKDHECRFWGFGAGSVPKLFLVEACKKSEIDTWLQQADEYSGSDEPAVMFSAIQLVDRALKAFPESPAARHLTVKIDQGLQQWSEPILGWLLTNKINYLVRFSEEFPKLEELVTNLSFSQIIKIPNNERRTQVLDLIRVCLGKCAENILIHDLSRVGMRPVAPSSAASGAGRKV